MKATDIIFALVLGRLIGFLVGDFLREWGIDIGLYWGILIWIIFPVFSLFCLWVVHAIGRKFLAVFQLAKFVLVGAGATIIDLKIFEFLAWLFLEQVPFAPIVAKSISFLTSTSLKYWGNKYWAFQEYQLPSEPHFDVAQDDQRDIKTEMAQFFFITLVGLLIDTIAFYFFMQMDSSISLPAGIWLKLSVIFAALTAALWNFLGYKYLVFRR
jgi:putative flippase GtrA